MAQSKFNGFTPSLFKFLRELSKNNHRDWFQENKSKYEDDVLFPALDFVVAFESKLRKISPVFQAIPKRVGGSVMRIYRDTRFSKVKTPYKLNLGIQFRHEMGKDVHAPGFYLHIEPKQCFLGSGIWHPDSPTLKKIRTAIVENPSAWKRARDNKKFVARFDLAGDCLKNAPRDFDKHHPLLNDLKRKDFIGVAKIDQKQVTKPEFIDFVARSFSDTKPMMKFLCDALHIPF